MVHTIWFVVLSAMLAGYAVLDGFDLGVGTLHLLVGRNREERAQLIRTIGPVWNGNEVWLLAAGGAMVVAFPSVYAASFSGFYLALMLVLWLLILRGLSLEFRHQIDNALWHDAWDVVFSGSSMLLALLFGVAFANVLRGVPLDAQGAFQGSFALMLNPFALLGGVLGVVTLAQHGASWLALKTNGDLRDRARRYQRRLWGVMTAAIAATVAASFVVRPDFTRNFLAAPWLSIVPSWRVARRSRFACSRGATTTFERSSRSRRSSLARLALWPRGCIRSCCRPGRAARIRGSTSTTRRRPTAACALRSASSCSA